jgi:hypothetical protein
VDAILIRSDNTKIKYKTKEQRDESKPKVQSHNDKSNILIQKELNSKKLSKKN